MIIELISLIISIIAGIAVMIRWGILGKLMAEFLAKKIQNKKSSLKISAPNLTSTFDSNNLTSP
jgi:hypothetical protein